MISISIIIIIFGLVVYPFIQKKQAIPWLQESQGTQLARLYDLKNALVGSISQLDFDNDLGTINVDDYERLRKEYIQRASTILREISRIEETTAHEIEREIENLIQRQNNDAWDKIEIINPNDSQNTPKNNHSHH